MIILFDIDGTLLDENHLCDYEFVKTKIYPNKDLTFGVNSNRAIEDIQGIYDSLDFNGPIVAENGCYVILEGKEIKLVNEEFDVVKLKQTIENILRFNSYELSEMGQMAFVDTDTSKVLLMGDEYKVTQDNCLYVLSNGFRKYTINLHIRISRNGKLHKIPEVTKNAAELLRSKLGEDNKIRISNTEGTISIVPKECDKGKAIAFIKSKTDEKVAIVGDDEAEARAHGIADKVYSVSNAVPKLKEVSDYVAKQKYYFGVIEIIESLKNEK